jgi:hypothetical protein
MHNLTQVVSLRHWFECYICCTGPPRSPRNLGSLNDFQAKAASAQLQTNMQGLLQRVNQVEAAVSRAAGDEHMKGLVPYPREPAPPRAADTSPIQSSKYVEAYRLPSLGNGYEQTALPV